MRWVNLAGVIGLWQSALSGAQKATFREADFTGLGLQSHPAAYQIWMDIGWGSA